MTSFTELEMIKLEILLDQQLIRGRFNQLFIMIISKPYLMLAKISMNQTKLIAFSMRLIHHLEVHLNLDLKLTQS